MEEVINVKFKLDVTGLDPSCNLYTIINAPIKKDGKVVGAITNYHVKEKEAIGFVWARLVPELILDGTEIVSCELEEI